MPDFIKPVVFHDFAAGHMAEVLVPKAVGALHEYGYAYQANLLELKLQRYHKPLADYDPKHVFPMIVEFVEVWPDNYFDMEAVVGKQSARENCPRTEVIPELVWGAVDFLEKNDREYAAYLKTELNAWITGLIGTEQDFYDIAVKWLHRAGATAGEALAEVARRKREERRKAELVATTPTH